MAFAGGLGLEPCADPSKAIIPTAKQPTPRNATVLFIVSLLRKLSPDIENEFALTAQSFLSILKGRMKPETVSTPPVSC